MAEAGVAAGTLRGDTAARGFDMSEERARLEELALRDKEQLEHVLASVQLLHGFVRGLVSATADIGALMELVEEKAEEWENADDVAHLLGDYFREPSDSEEASLRDREVAAGLVALRRGVLTTLRRAGDEGWNVEAIAAYAAMYGGVVNLLYRIGVEAADAARAADLAAGFARRAATAAPTARAMAEALKLLGDEAEHLEQAKNQFDEIAVGKDTLEGVSALLTKAHLLGRRAEDQERVIRDNLDAVIAQARMLEHGPENGAAGSPSAEGEP